MKKKNFYITTTLPYANAAPHIGFALELAQADAFVRFQRNRGRDVFFNTGMDEHGQKIYQKALEKGEAPQAYVDRYSRRFMELLAALNVSEHNFIRTTDEAHISAAREFWKRCRTNGDIYKKKYRGLYCVADEIFLSARDIENGKCKNHPHLEPAVIEEENYFFAFSKYQKRLLSLYEKCPDFVIPSTRFHEIKSFVSRGLEDFSVSRLKERMPWGVPVPDDEEHVMYVWFDALVNYISAIGWPNDTEKFEKWWPVIQFAGKDNLGHQAARWQAMLMSAGIEPSRQVIIHGFITSGGEKMSKSVGNVIDPFDIIERFGEDALRYYLLREVSPFEDSDFTEEKFIEVYNANLANGLGNLVSRVMKMATSYGVMIETPHDLSFIEHGSENGQRFIDEPMKKFHFNEAMDAIWKEIANMDTYIQKTEPFKNIKINEEAAKKDVGILLQHIWNIGIFLGPFMPETARKIRTAIKENKMPEALFKRIG